MTFHPAVRKQGRRGVCARDDVLARALPPISPNADGRPVTPGEPWNRRGNG